jgi:hypothetical protein
MEAKDKIEMQTPVDDSGIFTKEKCASFPLVLVGAHRKQSLARAKLLVG